MENGQSSVASAVLGACAPAAAALAGCCLVRTLVVRSRLHCSGRAASPAAALPIQAAEPGEQGLSERQLQKLVAELEEKYFRSGLLPGGVLAVVRRGKLVAYREWGDLHLGSVLKLFSISKVFTSLAALQLISEGRLGLDDPVSAHVPEWPEDPKVEREDGALEKASAAVTLRHCLTHTGGFTYEMPAVHPQHAQRPPERRRLAARQSGAAAAAPVRRLRDLVEASRGDPLLFEPSRHFNYGGTGVNLLARAVEEVSGVNIAEYFRSHLFLPAGMRRTGFVIDEAQAVDCIDVRCHPSMLPAMEATMPRKLWWPRLKLRAKAWLAYLLGWPFLLHTPAGNGVLSPKKLWDSSLSLFHPDAGVVSTAFDFIRWLSMLTLDGQVLGDSGELVRAMPAAALEAIRTPATQELAPPFALDAPKGSGMLYAANDAHSTPAKGTRPQNRLPGQCFGLGACVVTEPSKAGLPARAQGSWHWMGFASTFFFVNPKEELAACFLGQLISHRTYPIHHELIDGVHRALL